MDLVINRDELTRASTGLIQQREELVRLRRDINRTFEELRRDWDSEAGDEFFKTFEVELLEYVDEYARTLRSRSDNLATAVRLYQQVFEAADAVANAQY